MEYLYFKSLKGNFGDDLNPWLWEKLWGDVSSFKKDVCFLGIGSILHNKNNSINNVQHKNKIVFGSGIRPSYDYKNFIIDKSWDIKFLRGPLSSYALGNKYKFITDAAYCMRFVDSFSQIKSNDKKYKVSLMPYFHSVDFFDWPKICDLLGIHYISPLSENGVEFTMNEIASSEVIITEAMHGAIIADALRVPWHRFVLSSPHTEGGRVSEFKWSDWLQSVGIMNPDVSYIPFYKGDGRINKLGKQISNNIISIELFNKKKTIDKLLEDLSNINNFYTSSDIVVNNIDSKLFDEIQSFRNELY